MRKAEAVIRKRGNQYCVFSHDGKNLGCSNTREGAQKRLKQVEFFKHKGSKSMNYNQAFDNFAKALNGDLLPNELSKSPDSTPRNIEVPSETLSVGDRLSVGTVAGFSSRRVLDKKDHFPAVTHTQAQSSMARVMQLTETPGWYTGNIADLRQEVYAGIMQLHPDIELNVRVPAEMVIALSDGQESASTSQSDIKNPADVAKKEVPQVSRPTLTSAQVQEALKDEDTRKAVAGRLMEMLDKQLEHMQTAKKLAGRLLKSGLKSEEFDQLSTYLQEDMLRELLSRGVTASTQATENRRVELLARMKNA